MVANKVIEAMVMLEVEEDATTLTIEMEMVTKIIVDQGNNNTLGSNDKSYIQCLKCKRCVHYKLECQMKLQNEQIE